jgi:hypothetical protein
MAFTDYLSVSNSSLPLSKITPLMRYFLLFVCLFATIFADAQPFKNLKRLEAVYATYTDDNNQQHSEAGQIYYEPTLGKPITEKELGQLYPFTKGNLPDTWLGMVRTKLSKTASAEYLVVFDWGMSDDYNYAFFLMEKDTLLPLQTLSSEGEITDAYIFGKEIYLPGNGYFYTTGHVNNMFNQRSKWTVQNNLLEETPQAFNYVGLETKAKAGFAIYADVELTQKVADIAAGNTITVLLNLPPNQAPKEAFTTKEPRYQQYDYYLIKSEFGLTGWMRIEAYSMETPIEGLFYAGD